MVVDRSEAAAERQHFPNARLRVAVGVDGGHGARLAERLSKLSNTGGRWGRWWLTRAKRQRSDLTLTSGWWSGVTAARMSVGKNRKGEKRLRPTPQQHFTRTDETERYAKASD